MRIGLSVNQFADLVALTGAVTKAESRTHPILGFVVFDLRREQSPPLALAASHLAVARIELPAMTPEAPGTDDPLLFAVPHDHLAKLAKLVPGKGQVWIDTTPSGVTIELATSSFDRIGSWSVPTASKRDLDAFPDEPTEVATGEPTVWASDDIARALALCAPAPSTHLQVTGSLLLESTWNRATCATTHPHRTADGTIILPAAAVPILARMAEGTDGHVTLAPGETWTHAEAGHARVYLSQLATAVDDYQHLFFGETVPPADVNINLGRDELLTALRRASALSPQVNFDVRPGTLVIGATDGSSHHRVDITNGPDMPPVATFNADVFAKGLEKLEPGAIILTLPRPGEGQPYAYVTDDETTVALVPQQRPPE